jgi:hypothetical protein
LIFSVFLTFPKNIRKPKRDIAEWDVGMKINLERVTHQAGHYKTKMK